MWQCWPIEMSIQNFDNTRQTRIRVREEQRTDRGREKASAYLCKSNKLIWSQSDGMSTPAIIDGALISGQTSFWART